MLFEVEIPLALEVAGNERKLEGLKLDLEDIDLAVVGLQADHVLGELGPLRGMVVLEYAGKVHQWVGFALMVERTQMDH